jgi:hypothetical protein
VRRVDVIDERLHDRLPSAGLGGGRRRSTECEQCGRRRRHGPGNGRAPASRSGHPWVRSSAHRILLRSSGELALIDGHHSEVRFRPRGGLVDIGWPASCHTVAPAFRAAPVLKQDRDGRETDLVYLRGCVSRAEFQHSRRFGARRRSRWRGRRVGADYREPQRGRDRPRHDRQGGACAARETVARRGRRGGTQLRLPPPRARRLARGFPRGHRLHAQRAAADGRRHRRRLHGSRRSTARARSALRCDGRGAVLPRRQHPAGTAQHDVSDAAGTRRHRHGRTAA